MMRLHSRLLRQRIFLPPVSPRPPASSALQRPYSMSLAAGLEKSFHCPWAINRRVGFAAAAAPISGGRSSSVTFTSSRIIQCEIAKHHNLIATSERVKLARRYAAAVVADVDGGGRGGGRNDNRGGGGGDGRGGSGDGAEAGGKGGWGWWTWYLGMLDTNPIITKAVTAGILNFVGDVACQFILEKAESLDWGRAGVMTLLGFGLVGPTLHLWYSTLSKLVKFGGAAGVGMRVVLDQFVFCPVFIGFFVSCLMTMEGKSDQVEAKLKQDWWGTVKANWVLWLPAQLINFGLMPLKLQVAFANFVGVFWNAYLSYKSHATVDEPEPAKAKA